jgi:hypothetical protein
MGFKVRWGVAWILGSDNKTLVKKEQKYLPLNHHTPALVGVVHGLPVFSFCLFHKLFFPCIIFHLVDLWLVVHVSFKLGRG